MRYVQQLQLLRGVAQQHTAKIESGTALPSSALSNNARERMKKASRA